MSTELLESGDDLGQEYASIQEMAETLEEKADLITDLAFRVLVENRTSMGSALAYSSREFGFQPGEHGELYRLPNHPDDFITQLEKGYDAGRPIGGNMRAMPPFVIRGSMTSEGVPFVRVEQQCLLGYPLGKDGVFLATMTECTALIAKSETTLYFAHVGYGERGNVSQVMDFFQEKGVSSDEIVAVVMDRKLPPDNEWHQSVTRGDLIEYGLSSDNVLVRSSNFFSTDETPDRSFGHDNACQVTVTPEFVSLRSVNYRTKRVGWDGTQTSFEAEKDLVIKEL